MKVCAHQPSYFPWLGLLDKIAKSDLYIFEDEVQMNVRAYQHRNIFLRNDGTVSYLTVNIHRKGYTGIVGMEHGNSQPGADGEKRLIEAYREVDSFEV